MVDPELHVIFDSQDGVAEIDVVAVHGLNFMNSPAHARETWAKGGCLWLKDFLPAKLPKPCRVMLFEYNSSPAMGASAIKLDDHAKNLLQWLNLKRKDALQRPLVFIAHSLGGLVVKQALVEAMLDVSYKSTFEATRLLVCFATPHQGGNYAGFGDIVAKALKEDSDEATRRFEQSRHLFERCLVVNFFEGDSYGKLGIIVDKKSVTLNLPGSREKRVAMHADHSSLCKFDSAQSPACELVLETISTELESALRTDLNTPSPFPTKDIHWLVPRVVNPLFTGRSDIVKRIKDALLSTTTALDQKRFVLTGIGGQGKSEVCLRVVNEIRESFWGIFWVDVGSDSIAQAEFSKIAEELGSTAKGVDDVRKLLSNSSPEHSWLLVLDNADDLDADYQKYFPTGNRGAVLMASRVRECGRYGTVGSEEIDSLAEQDCVNLLMKGVGVPEASWPGYISAAKNIINVVQSHTLALLQAAAYIAEGHCSMAGYPQVFQRQRERLLRFGPKQAQSRYGNVYTTFEASVGVLKSFETEPPPDSLILLHLLSTLHYESIPLDLFEDAWHGSQVAQANPLDDDTIGHLSVWHVSQLPAFLRNNVDTWDPFRFTAALSQLESLALVKKNNTRGYWTVTMHPLVHSWLAIRQNHAQISQALQTTACIIALSRYSQPAWQRSGHPSWRLYRGCLGLHLLTLLRSDIRSAGPTKQSIHILQIFIQIGWLLHDIRYDQELARLLDWIFQQIEADPECPSEGVLLLSDIALQNAYSLGRIKKYIKISKEIVRIGETILKNHPDQLESQQTLAIALLADGQTKQAVTLLEHIVRVWETTPDEGHPDRLASQHVLASTLLADGQTKQAVTLFEHVFRVQEATLDEGHPHRLASQHVLASALLADGQIKQAVMLFEHVVRVQETTLDESHPDRLAPQHELANAIAVYAEASNGSGYIPKARQPLSWVRNPFRRGLSALKNSRER